MSSKLKIIRACTVPMSVIFVTGMLPELQKRYEVVLLSSPGHELDEAEEEYGVRGIRVPMERHISLGHDFVSLCRLFFVFFRERPVMVHSMTPKAGLLCMIAAWLTRVPIRVHTFTGLVFPTASGFKRKILMLTDSLTCACATHVIPEGDHWQHTEGCSSTSEEDRSHTSLTSIESSLTIGKMFVFPAVLCVFVHHDGISDDNTDQTDNT